MTYTILLDGLNIECSNWEEVLKILEYKNFLEQEKAEYEDYLEETKEIEKFENKKIEKPSYESEVNERLAREEKFKADKLKTFNSKEKKINRKNKKWLKSEDAQLWRYIENKLKRKRICRVMNRTKFAVNNRISILKRKKRGA